MRAFVLVAGLALCLTRAAQPQDRAPIDLGVTLTLQSEVLNEPRTIDVVPPPGYHGGTERFPLLVVLDGESLLLPAVAAARFLASLGEIPPMIVIGVRNTQRMRDMTSEPLPSFTPPPPPAGESFGGLDAFVRFLAGEMLPLVDREYRTQPHRTLVGHSLGGLVALHAALSRSEAFPGVLALDPSTWWNDRRVVRGLAAHLAASNDPRVRIALVNAADTLPGRASRDRMGPLLSHVTIDGETHASLPVTGIAQGLRAVFADYPLPRLGASDPPTAALLAHHEALERRLGYAQPPTIAALVRAGRQAVDGRMFDDAFAAVAALESRAAGAQAAQLRQRLADARTQGSEGFIPLVIPPTRPSAEQAARFLGTWRGTVDMPPPSVDFRHELTVAADGDTLVLRGRSTMPNGQVFDEGLQVVTLRGEVFEWGRPLRGVPGLEVYVSRIDDAGELVGHVEIRGFRPPPGHGTARFRYARVSP